MCGNSSQQVRRKDVDVRSSARNAARRAGKVAADMWPLLNLKNPYHHPALRKVWNASRNQQMFQDGALILSKNILKTLREEDLFIL